MTTEQVPTKEKVEQCISRARQMDERGFASPIQRVVLHLAKLVEQNDIEAAVEAVRKDSPGWQPIETAPPTDRNNPVYVAYPRFKNENRTMVPDEYICFTAYCDNLGWDTGFWRLHEMPHYWHPLPGEPTTMRDGAQIVRPSMETS